MDRIARAAGILEGEGSFYTRTQGHAPKVSCQMSDEDVILELKDLFGGNVRSNTVSKEHYKPTWTWSISGDAAMSVMISVRPFMFARRQAAIDKALSVWDARKAITRAQKDKADEAARAWTAGEGSLREISKKYGVGYETIRRHAMAV